MTVEDMAKKAKSRNGFWVSMYNGNDSTIAETLMRSGHIINCISDYEHNNPWHQEVVANYAMSIS